MEERPRRAVSLVSTIITCVHTLKTTSWGTRDMSLAINVTRRDTRDAGGKVCGPYFLTSFRRRTIATSELTDCSSSGPRATGGAGSSGSLGISDVLRSSSSDGGSPSAESRKSPLA
jgi:hypothetical protein